MRRPTSRRATQRRGPDRRIIAAVAVLVAFGAVIGITQISNADENKPAACKNSAAAEVAAGRNAAADPRVGTYRDQDGDVQHKGDGQLAKGEKAAAPKPATKCTTGKTTVTQVNGLQILANSCEDSDLDPHDGFQKGNRCVSTEFGEVGDESRNPTLLITEFPRSVKANTPFTLKVSTRNLVRDRFLAAGQGGYYVESSLLTDGGLVRGHFHTACRMLSSLNEAVDPAPAPAFFVATEDKRGGAQPDTVTIRVPGLPQEGIAQCASWAGDGSHRVPMMARANQTPAIDAVRVLVEDDNDGDGNGNGGGNNNGGGGNNGGGNNNPGDGNNNPGDGNNNPGDGNNNPGDGNNNPGGGNGNNNGGDNDNSDNGDNGNGGNGNAGGGNDNGGNGGDDEAPDPGATATPRTGTGATPPKTDTVTIPPRTAPKPAKTTKPAKTDDDESADDESADDESAQALTGGRTTKPAATKKQAAAEPEAEEQPAADVATDDNTEEPELRAETVRNEDSKLALTGANSMTLMLGGTLLALCGAVLLGATRRRRANRD